MPENQSVLAAPVGAPSVRERLTAVADALGTTPGRVVAGMAVAVVLAVALGWTLLASPASVASVGAGAGIGAGGAGDGALPRAVPSAPSSTDAAEAASGGPAYVYVTGAVAQPGVYRAPPDARVADVLDAAGGPAPDADLVQLNLAAPVSDGERVYVPRKGEPPPAGVPSGVAAGAGLVGGAVPAGLPVNLNTATAEQLDALPGVGPSTARAILAWRQQHGRFKRVDDLLHVRGIGPAKLEALRTEVRV
ncbi:MAG: competence protein ComEA [Acidimicrobiaceae bacterium]|nr:competence protein ComEA [Acidimicrobiaceae bacterium]